MKHKILSIMLALAASLPFVACEDQLDIEKTGNKGSQETYYCTDADARSAVAAAYWMWFECFDGITTTANMLSDDIYCGGSDPSDDVDYHNLNNYNIKSENGRVESDYSQLYRLIYYSNIVIQNVGNYTDTNPETEVKQMSVAEAYFFRGFAHFWLAVFWGNAPIVDHLLNPDEYHVGNSADGACMQQAADDIKHAVDMNALKSKSGPEDKSAMAYITQEGAEAMLGKIYLYQEKYHDAAVILNKVIDSNKYDLYSGAYENILKNVSNWSCEGVLEAETPNAPQNGDVAWAFDTYRCISPGWRNDAFDWANSGIYEEKTYGPITVKVIKPEYEDFNFTGYGFSNPRKGLYDAFVESDGADGYRTQSVIKTSDWVKNTMGLVMINRLHGHDHYFNWKNRFLKSDMTWDNGGWNIICKTTQRWMRYAEVLLNAAEANFMDGNTTLATKYVNRVRERAQATLRGTVTLDQIKLERRVELFNEHNRWPDLVRWGEAANTLKDQGKITLDLGTDWQTYEDVSSNPSFGFRAGVNERLPYPAEECRLNPNVKQNPGY